MAASLTVGDLFKAKAVTDEQVNAAVEQYLAEPRTSAHPIAEGYTVDLAAAVAGHGWASQLTANPDSHPVLKRAAVQTAILLARARKARRLVKKGRANQPAER
ncbi:hypothetical protein [Methylobacterium sp. R2-1]|uniref:hypothetical protein n=1 Tax=Methylobacterium sp. R2-1 TaxID=2587064 RepID=UPI00161B9B7F|nr:hypothetical protein [Methylobacterium sp. R2-1]MBB2961550.1 hypothetical protein [Methylobacterium sp. R2-1]